MESKKTLINILLCCLLIIPVTPATIPCQEKLDVVVMIDGSDSIKPNDFTIFKNALDSLVQQLDIGFDKTRLGLILYSSTVTKIVDFSSHPFLLRAAIRNLEQPQDGTNTHLAIEDAVRMVRDKGRSGVAKFALVITDGLSKDPVQTATQASILKSLGVSTFAIGVTDSVNNGELLSIASDPSQVKITSSFSDLASTLENILPDICPTTPPPTTQPPTTRSITSPQPNPTLSLVPCQEKLDVVVMIDGSDSIKPDDFTIFKNALESLVQQLDIGFDKTRLGLILYSSTVTESIGFSYDPFSLRSQIRNLEQPQDGTNTHLAIEDAVRMVGQQGRPGVAKIALVITDGLSKNPPQTATQASILRSLGVSTFAIGVTDDVNDQELRNIASSPSQVKYASTFSDLASTIRNILPDICPTTTPRTTPIPTTRPTPTARIGIDTTTSAVVDDSLCGGCKMDNGIGFNPHPTDCQKFIQCMFEKDGVKAIVRNCGFGLFWDHDLLTCNAAAAVKCANDPCLKPGATHFRSAYNCRHYYSCSDRLGAATCCDEGYSFSNDFNRCIPEATCKTACTANPAPPTTPCNKEAISGRPGWYKEDVPGHGLLDRPCAAGTTFNPTDCECSSAYDTVFTVNTPTVPVNTECKPVLDLQFDEDEKDTSAHKNWVQNDGVSFENGWAYFDGNGILRVPRFSNVPLGATLRIKMRYRGEGTAFSQQALVTNRDCGRPGSVAILLDQSKTTFTTRNVNEAVTSVDVNVPSQTQWKEVEFQVANGVLSGTVDGQTNTKPVVGDIRKSECALQIGHGNTYQNFKGHIDYVQVFMC